jgi:hypothetical protein
MSFRNSPMQAERGSRGTTPPILNFGARRGRWSTSHSGTKPRYTLCRRRDVSQDQCGLWGRKMSCPYRVSNSRLSIPRSLVVPITSCTNHAINAVSKRQTQNQIISCKVSCVFMYIRKYIHVKYIQVYTGESMNMLSMSVKGICQTLAAN